MLTLITHGLVIEKSYFVILFFYLSNGSFGDTRFECDSNDMRHTKPGKHSYFNIKYTRISETEKSTHRNDVGYA